MATASSAPAFGAAGSAWGIQVGAFGDAGSARQAAQRAVAATHSLTGNGVIHVEPSGRRKTLYQARIGNVGRTEASRACSVLKQKKFKCMVFKLDRPLAVAGTVTPALFERPVAKPQLLDSAVLRISDHEPFREGERASDGDRVSDGDRASDGDRVSDGDRSGDGDRASDGERRWGVQVGAYRSPEPALSMATMATAKADDVLRSGTITVVQRRDRTRSFYLARIHGLTRSGAEAACAKLRQSAIDCLIVQLVEETQAGWDVGPITADLRPVSVNPEAGGSAGSSDWGIQVGAFPASAQARSTAQKAVRALPETLEPGVIQIVPVATEKSGTVYRARIVGIDRSSAAQACRLLSLERFACMILRVSDDSLAAAD
jgi:cell division protein FtsN